MSTKGFRKPYSTDQSVSEQHDAQISLRIKLAFLFSFLLSFFLPALVKNQLFVSSAGVTLVLQINRQSNRQQRFFGRDMWGEAQVRANTRARTELDRSLIRWLLCFFI